MRHVLAILLCLSFCSCLPQTLTGPESAMQPSPFYLKSFPQQSLSLLSGSVTQGILQEAWFFKPGLVENSFFLNLAWNQTLAEVYLNPEITLLAAILKEDRRLFGWEAEVNVAKHLGQQDHVEINALLLARWHVFIWDKWLDMSIAMGEGLSYASSIPKIEAERWLYTNQLLNYMLYEMTFGLDLKALGPTPLSSPHLQAPHLKAIDFVMRIHHRSGVYGTFNGVTGASNVANFGLRFSF
ncbi:MAG: hypothetical protein R2880_09945 [Deinococcales bacterium]